MTLPPFTLHRPTTLAQALQLLERYADEAAFYMGGTELLLLMKLGFAAPGHLVDGKRLAELAQLSVGDQQMSIGAGVTHRRLERHSDVRRVLPALAQLEQQVANVRVRNAGTLGGNLCFAEPHSDPLTLLVALGATVRLVGPHGIRELPLEEFCLGAFSTALAENELMLSVEVPLPAHGTGVGYARIAFKERPDVGAAVILGPDASTVVIGAVGPRPMRITDAERSLDPAGDASLDEAVAAVRAAVAEAGVDDYRAHLAGVLVARAHASAVMQAAAGSRT